jgi:DNA-binding NarL/FixJ family response regulator
LGHGGRPELGFMMSNDVEQEKGGSVPSIRVLLVDDHAMFRSGVVSLLRNRPNIEVVGEADSGERALALAVRLKPDVVVLDISMLKGSGLDAARRIKIEAPTSKILMLTVSDAASDLIQALDAGASGYLLKSAVPDELVSALSDVVNGLAPFSQAMTPKLVEELLTARSHVYTPAPVDQLTRREVEVLRFIGTGASNAQIARALVTTPNTVKMHVHHILDKLQLSNRTEAAAYAARAGLADRSKQAKTG